MKQTLTQVWKSLVLLLLEAKLRACFISQMLAEVWSLGHLCEKAGHFIPLQPNWLSKKAVSLSPKVSEDSELKMSSYNNNICEAGDTGAWPVRISAFPKWKPLEGIECHHVSIFSHPQVLQIHSSVQNLLKAWVWSPEASCSPLTSPQTALSGSHLDST